jgi:hypothetical protein
MSVFFRFGVSTATTVVVLIPEPSRLGGTSLGERHVAEGRNPSLARRSCRLRSNQRRINHAGTNHHAPEVAISVVEKGASELSTQLTLMIRYDSRYCTADQVVYGYILAL